MTELEKWNEYLRVNYMSIKAHIRNQMYFQTFGDYDDDDLDEALTLIGEAVSRGYIIRYEKVMQLIFVSYKNLCLQKIMRQSRYGGEYNDNVLYNEDENEDYKEMDTSVVADMLQDIKDNFPEEYSNVIKRYMNGKLDKYVDRGKWMEIRHYLRYRYSDRQNHIVTMQHSNNRKIYQYDKNGNLIAEYNSLRDCVQKTGLSKIIIKNYLDGKIDFAYSYHWTYDKK